MHPDFYYPPLNKEIDIALNECFQRRLFSRLVSVDCAESAYNQFLVKIIKIGMNCLQRTVIFANCPSNNALSLKLKKNLIPLFFRAKPLFRHPEDTPDLLPGFPTRKRLSSFHAIDRIPADTGFCGKVLLGQFQCFSPFYVRRSKLTVGLDCCHALFSSSPSNVATISPSLSIMCRTPSASVTIRRAFSTISGNTAFIASWAAFFPASVWSMRSCM